MTETIHPFEKLGLPRKPVILAPLAGVSDHPFRRICAGVGADLTYVEMLSATALVYRSPKTFEMCKRHESEKILGVQLTGRSADETAEAVSILDQMNFDTIDLNMGCVVQKIVKVGCGSAILKDPARVFDTVKKCKAATSKLLSAKIRIGWDHNSLNGIEVAKAIEEAGAAWLTVHGRTRSDDYGAPVDLESIAKIKSAVKIPVIGNGNIFSKLDADYMLKTTQVDGVMVSRGALGNPWIFDEIKGKRTEVTLPEWFEAVCNHIEWQSTEYGFQGNGAVCMRKHLLWYAKGWQGVKNLREQINQLTDLKQIMPLLEDFYRQLSQAGQHLRPSVAPVDQSARFNWDPKFEMDRKLDRGVGDDELLDA